jgi:hypothetical protein
MENISTLDKFSWPFQVIGLQCFSLQNINTLNKRKYKHGIFIFFLLIWLIFFGLLSVYEFNISTSNVSNYLGFVITFMNYINYNTSIGLSFIQTYLKHHKLVKFFQNSAKISSYCETEFHYKTNFSSMKRKLMIWIIIYFTYFSIFCYQKFSVSSRNNIIEDYILPIFWVQVVILINMVVFRFNFYVQIINFHLEDMKTLIQEHFANDFNISAKFGDEILKIRSNRSIERKKVYVLRKMYLLLKEMGSIVDETMGLIVFLRLFMVSTHFIRFGYK